MRAYFQSLRRCVVPLFAGDRHEHSFPPPAGRGRSVWARRRRLLAEALEDRIALASDLFTGTDAGVPGQVKVFNSADLSEKASFFAYGAVFTGGVRISTAFCVSLISCNRLSNAVSVAARIVWL